MAAGAVAAHLQSLERGVVARQEAQRLAQRPDRLVVASQGHEDVGVPHVHEGGLRRETHGCAHVLESLLRPAGDAQPRPVDAVALGVVGGQLNTARQLVPAISKSSSQ